MLHAPSRTHLALRGSPARARGWRFSRDGGSGASESYTLSIAAVRPELAERARDFAPAVLGLDEIGRLALAVLDRGLFLGSRVVDLVSVYLRGVEEADGALQGDAGSGEAAS